MAVQTTFDNLAKILGRPLPSHPHAHGGFGFWVIYRPSTLPLGWVIMTNTEGAWTYETYAYCRDDAGKRPWLRTFATLNSAVAWMLQHEADIRKLIAENQGEPEGLATIDDSGA